MKQALASSNPSIGADIIKKDGMGPQKPDSETMWTQRITSSTAQGGAEVSKMENL